MVINLVLALLVGFFVTLSHQTGFTSPNYVVSYGPGQYQSNVLWHVGEKKDIVYDIRDVSGLDTYTIALWQQSKAGGGATLGPVVKSKPTPTSHSLRILGPAEDIPLRRQDRHRRRPELFHLDRRSVRL
jgi:hypothetical protein